MNPVVTLNKVECLLFFLEQLIPTNCTWALSKCHGTDSVSCLPTDGCPNLSCLLVSKDTVVSFFLPLGHEEGEQPGWPWQTWSTSMLPRISEHSEVTGLFPADPSLLPRIHFKRNKRRVLWGVKSRPVLFQRELFQQQLPHHHKHSGETWCKNEITENIFGLTLGFI